MFLNHSITPEQGNPAENNRIKGSRNVIQMIESLSRVTLLTEMKQE